MQLQVLLADCDWLLLQIETSLLNKWDGLVALYLICVPGVAWDLAFQPHRNACLFVWLVPDFVELCHLVFIGQVDARLVNHWDLLLLYSSQFGSCLRCLFRWLLSHVYLVLLLKQCLGWLDLHLGNWLLGRVLFTTGWEHFLKSAVHVEVLKVCSSFRTLVFLARVIVKIDALVIDEIIDSIFFLVFLFGHSYLWIEI